jgi:hypothetical protein
MKKIIMLLLVNINWNSSLFAQVFNLSDTLYLHIEHGLLIEPVIHYDTLTASLLVTHNNRGIAHPHDGFVLTENGMPTGKYLDVNKQPIKKPITVWYYELNVVHKINKRHRPSLCH